MTNLGSNETQISSTLKTGNHLTKIFPPGGEGGGWRGPPRDFSGEGMTITLKTDPEAATFKTANNFTYFLVLTH